MKKALVIMSLVILITIMSIPVFAGNSYPQVASVTSVQGTLSVFHAYAPNWFAGYPKMPAYLYDTLKTDANSYSDIQFKSGGALGINQNTTIQITGSKEVTNTTQNSTVQNIIIKSGEIWAKITKQQEEIQFQTNGGVIAIKGTEFVIEEHPDKQESVVSVLEGTVAYRSNNKETLYNAGDKITIPWKDVPVVKQYEPQQLRNECDDKFKELRKVLDIGLQILSTAGVSMPSEALMAVSFIDNPNQLAQNMLNAAMNNSGVSLPFGISMPSNDGGSEKPDFPYNLTPDQVTVETFNPDFKWDKLEDLSNYWFFISDQEDMKNLLWNKKLNTNLANYPKDAKPLAPGKKYYWRVIALDEKDEPKGKASQTFFTVSDKLQLTSDIKALYPVGDASFYNGSLAFYWTKDPAISNHKLIVADNKDLANPIISENCQENTYLLPDDKKTLFTAGKTFYWQIQPLDDKNNPLGSPSGAAQFTLK